MKFLRQAAAIGILGLLVTMLAACGSPAVEEPLAPTAPAAPEAEVPPPEPENTPTPAWSPSLLYSVQIEAKPVNSLAAAPGAGHFAVGAFERVYLYNLSDGQLVSEIETRHNAEDLSFSPDGGVLGVGLDVYGVELINPQDGSQIQDLPRGYNSRVKFSPDGGLLATSDRGTTIWFWDAAEYSQVNEVESPGSEWISALEFSPDGKVLAASRWNCAVDLWNVESFERITSLERDPAGVCQTGGIAFSPDGAFLAGVEMRLDGVDYVRVWSTGDNSVLQDLPLPDRAIDVAFSPDSALLAAGLEDNRVLLWSLPEFTLLHNLPLQSGDAADRITVLSISPDSQKLLAGRANGVVEVWQIQP